MILSILKTAVITVFCFFILVGCQNATKPIQDAVDYTTGKVQLEQKKQADKTLAQVKCRELCQTTLSNDGQDFDVGPCLSNEIIQDWVCDIVHSPRQEVDDDPANQCPSFRTGQTHHFVELDGNCDVIKVY
jgi:hypothetical protein